MNTANTCAMATRTNQKSDNNHEQARMNEMTTYARQGKVNEIKRLLDEGVCPNLVMTKVSLNPTSMDFALLLTDSRYIEWFQFTHGDREVPRMC